MKTNENPERERKEMEEMIQGKEWFKLLPEHTRRTLLKQSSDYLALLLEQEVVIVTTNDEADFAFGYNTEGKPVIRIPEFSATLIGVAKLNMLKLEPAEKMRFIIENRSLMERPLSDKKKKIIAELLKKIGDIRLWELGAMIEEKTRDVQLRIETGRIEINYLPRMEINQKMELPEIILRNYLWLWQEIYSNCKRAEFHNSVSTLCRPNNTIRSKEEKPPILYQIRHHPYGRNTVVSAIGPFSALKLASSFPLDDPDRFEFWERKWDHWPDADNFSSVGILQVIQRRDRVKKPEVLQYTCPKCDGKGNDPEFSTEYERETNAKGEFICWRCGGTGCINEEDEGNPRNRFFDALKYIERKNGATNDKSMLEDLLPHLHEETLRSVWIWSSIYYKLGSNTPESLTRKIALPTTNSYLEIKQQIVRGDPIWAQGDLMGVTDDIEEVPIELKIIKISDAEKPESIEYIKEAKDLLEKWKVKK